MEEMKRLLIDVVMATLPMTTVTADLFIFSPPLVECAAFKSVGGALIFSY